MEKQALKIRGGVRVPHFKDTAESGCIKMPAPPVLVLPMQQHIGVTCSSTVSVGEKIAVGQVIGDTDSLVSAPIHAPASGKVKAILPYVLPNGLTIDAIHIETDGQNNFCSSVRKPGIKTSEDFIRAIRQSGVVGLGGAGFPTHVKLTMKQGVKIDTLIINGAECEPYITADYLEIMENYTNILNGIERVKKYIGINKCIIGIESNKPKAIALLTEKIVLRSMQGYASVVELPALYPYGAEKMLIRAVTGRIVPLGGLPCDVGTIVINISTISVLNNYLDTGIPLIQKRITLAGRALANPQNILVPIGTPIQDVIDFSGGFKEEPFKIIKGGPMMGIAQQDFSTPILKHDNAILCLTAKETYIPEALPCIRCGRCVQTCPMRLMPTFIERNVNRKNAKMLAKLNVSGCLECGSCAYVCPSKRPLIEYIRKGKQIEKVVNKND